MILTKRMIDQLRFPGRMDIDGELEALLLRRFSEEPKPYEYSEQDLHEQVRDLVARHNRGKDRISRPSDWPLPPPGLGGLCGAVEDGGDRKEAVAPLKAI